MALHVELHKWDEAKMLAKQNPEMEAMIWLPYADWLSANDKFDEAQEAYKKAGRPDLSLRIIEFLTYNAVTEKRFQDAAQYYWMLSAESLRLVKETGEKASKEDKKFLGSFEEYMKLAEIYQAYHLIHKFIEESYQAVIQGPLFNEAIFNASRFLINNLGKRQPLGVSKVYTYYALSILGFRFEAFKTARLGYEKLQQLKIPAQWQEEIDLASLKCRSKPFSDKESFEVICNRCMAANPLINPSGDFCTGCG
jgi:intraflagellar transport protein 122